jgi:hypothetical protein
MSDHRQSIQKQTLRYGITVFVLLLISHVLVEQIFFVKLLLSIADLKFWEFYFDPIYYTVFAIIFIVIQRRQLIESLQDYRKNYKKYLPHVSISVLIMFLLIIIVAITLSSLGIGDSSNETAISEAVKASPIIEGATALLIGPFVEEMVFRGFIYEIVRRKIKDNRKLLICLWILIATVLFTLHHCNLEDFKSLKAMASYLIVFVEGLVMTGLYEKDRNIFSSLLLHCIINVLAFMN